jgi:hypothetical protein
MHHDSFNADFYFAAVTVIPVLFLTFALQGPTFERWLTLIRAMRIQAGRSAREQSTGVYGIYLEAIFAFWFILFGMIAATLAYVLGAGIWGEWAAIFGLYARTGQDAVGIRNAMLTLLLAVGIGPALRFLGQFFGIDDAIRRRREKRQPPHQDSEEPSE